MLRCFHFGGLKCRSWQYFLLCPPFFSSLVFLRPRSGRLQAMRSGHRASSEKNRRVGKEGRNAFKQKFQGKGKDKQEEKSVKQQNKEQQPSKSSARQTKKKDKEHPDKTTSPEQSTTMKRTTKREQQTIGEVRVETWRQRCGASMIVCKASVMPSNVITAFTS